MNAPHASLSTVKIDLGQLHREDKKEASFSIKNTGKDPLLIRKLSTSDKSITLSIDKTKIKKGRKATVRVVIDTSKALGDILNSKVTIITNDPDSPQRIVRVVGLFK